jgi:transcriptional regulator GlxA family with amidase domain
VRNQSDVNLGAGMQGITTSAVRRALAEMQDNLETPLSLSEISAVVACSPKPSVKDKQYSTMSLEGA